MTNLTRTNFRLIPALLCLLLSLVAGSTQAAVFYWDNNGTGTPTSGTWDTTTAQWATSSVLTASTVAWNTANAACFTAGSGVTGTINITVNSAITIAGIFNGQLNPSGVALTLNGSGSLNLPAGSQAALATGGSDGQPTVVNIPFTGPGQLWPEGSKNVTLGAHSTYSGGTVLNQGGLLFFTFGDAFGTGPIYPFVTGSPTSPGFTAILDSGSSTITIGNNFIIASAAAGLNFANAATAPVVCNGTWDLMNSAYVRCAGGVVGGLTLNGVIGDVGALNLSANNNTPIVLNGANTYGGGTTLSSGSSGVEAVLGNASALGYGPVTVNSASSLELNGQSIGNAITVNGTGTNNNGALINSSATTANLNAGAVGSVTITAGGSGYLAPPTVTISGGGGSGATGTALLGVSSASFTITPGTQLYTVAPTVTIGGGPTVASGPNSSSGGATATIALAGTAPSVVASTVTITAAGSGFTGAPNLTFGTGTKSGSGTLPTAVGNATQFTVTGVAITSPGSGYTSAPTVGFSSGGATATAAISAVNLASASSLGGSGNITINDVVAGTGTLTKIGAGTVTLTGANTYSGATTVSVGTLAQGAANVIPNGSGKGAFAVSSGATFNLGGFDSTLNNAASAGTIDNLTGGGTPTLSIGGNNTAVNLSGVIKNTTGTLALNKIGTGAMTLSGANTYSGKTTVNAGTLNISSDGNLGTAPGSYVADQLTLNGGTIAFTATAVDLPANRGVTLGASGGTLSVSANQSPFIDSIITGSGSLTKSSSGNINLDAANTFSGGLTITGGGVRFNNNSAAGTGTITVTPASIVTLRQLNPPGPTSVTINNPVILNANNGNDIDLTGATGNTLTLAGDISGPGYLTISRGGTLGTIVLSGNNTYVGPTTINAGTLQLGSSTALGGGTFNYANPILVNTPAAVAGGFLYPVQVNTAGILDLNAQTMGNSISLNGGQLINNNASPATVNGSPSGGIKVVFSNGGTGVAAGSTVNITGGGGSGAAATISSFGLTTASFTLNSGGSGYTGTTPTATISGDGSGATASVSRGVTAATFTITSGTTTYSVAPNVTISGGNGSGATATANLNGSGVVTSITIVTPGSGFTTAPTIAFAGGTVLVSGTNPTGAGNANNFTVVSVAVTAPGSGYTIAPTLTFSTGTASATGNANNFTVTSINTTAAGSGYTSTPTVTLSSGSGYVIQAIVVNDITLLANSTIGGTGDTTVSEPLIGAFGLTKSGAGKVTLNAANTYSGATTVSTGTLLVNSPGSLAGGAVGVSSGATLGGTGTIGGVVTVSAGGILSPGAPLGTLTLTVAPSLGGTTAMDINKAAGPVLSSDELVVSPGGGTLVYGGILAVTSSGLPLVKGDTFTLFSADSYSGSFSSITPAAPGPGLAWDASRLTVDGTLRVVCDGTLAAHAGADQSLCNLASAVIGGTPAATGGSGGYTYGWSPATGLSDATLANPTASATTTTTYTLTVTDSVGCTAISTVTVTAGAAPTISAGPTDQTVCSGSSATFSVTASGPGTISYSWAKNDNSGWGSAWTTSGSGATFRSSATDNDFGDPACNSLSPTSDINSPSGNALGIWGGFSGDEVATRSFAALAAGQAVSIDFDNGNVDTGSKVGFSMQTSGGVDVLQFYFVGGQSNYKYNDGTEQDTGIPFQRTGLRVQFALTSASDYTLILTPCGGTATRFNGTFSGTIAQLKLFNQNNTGGNDKNIYFNNFLVGGYTDNADNYSGDFAGQDKGNQPIAAGNGGSSYTTPALSVADSGTQYQVVVSGCGGSVVSTNATVTVNPLPTASVDSTTICAGGSATLTATTSASSPTYLWSPGGATTASITVSPASTTTYTVTVTEGTTSCGNNGSGTVTVNPLPTVSVDSAAICAGGSATLTATTSASSPAYLWSPGGATTASITVSPASTTTYTVTVTDGTTTCANSGSGTLTVNPLPTVSVNSAMVCAGGSTTLTASTSAGSPSFLWSPGGATTASITVSPASTTTYTVTVTDGTTTCANSGSGTATVNPLPTVSVNSATVCADDSATLTATTSASSPAYLWSPGGATTASITVSPASTTTYTVTVTDGTTSCANSGSGTVTVNPLPALTTDTTNQTACAGSVVTWQVEATGTSLTYQWQRDGTNLLEGVDNFTGTTTSALTNSSVSALDSLGAPNGYACVISSGTCSVTSTLASLTVNPLPTVSVNSETVCAGTPATLTATTSAGTPSYLWSPGGDTTASITVSPATTTTYTVTVTDGTTGCGNSASGTVTVNPLPTVSVNSMDVCAGGSATLTATTSASNPSYLWSPGGATTASITVSPASTTTYSVTVTDGSTSCANSGSGTVTVHSPPTASAGSDQAVCTGTLVEIGGSPTATGGTGPYTYSWAPATGLSDATLANPAATVTTATTYTVTVTDAYGCTATSSINLTIIPTPTIQSITPAGTDVTLVWTALAGQTYRVQYKNNILDASWTDLAPDVTAAGATASKTDSVGAAPQRFYRISVLCP